MSGDNSKTLYGLVLAGGKSVRMGHDKGMVDWYGEPQRYYMADLLSKVCDKVYISCREDQVEEMGDRYPTITDAYTGAGPMGGILSAQEQHPDKAWLVVATDLPLVDMNTLKYLITNRNVDTIATTFKSPHDQLPEPLITIWEPGSYEVLLGKMKEGFKCPRKVLINSNATLLQAPDDDALINANTPEDAAAVRLILQQKVTIR